MIPFEFITKQTSHFGTKASRAIRKEADIDIKSIRYCMIVIVSTIYFPIETKVCVCNQRKH